MWWGNLVMFIIAGIFIYLAIVLYINAKLFLYAIVVIPPLAIFLDFIGKKIKK